MELAFATAAIVLVVLLSVLVLPRLQRSVLPVFQAVFGRIGGNPRQALPEDFDPGRELRAEQRARTLLRSCINEEEWAMYSELGFLRVWGTLAKRSGDARRSIISLDRIARRVTRTKGVAASQHAYLLYPHKPILAYLPHTGEVLGEYCVEFPDHTRPYGSSRLPDADDVLAKWMALRTWEHTLIGQANMHLPGRQIRFEEASRDLDRLACWEREHFRSEGRRLRLAGSVPAL